MIREEFLRLAAAGYNRIPMARETLADFDTPLSIYLKLADEPNSYLLESVQGGEKWGRYSIIGLPCRTVLRVHDHHVSITHDGIEIESHDVQDPLAFVEAFKARYQMYPSSSAASAYSIVQQWADAARRSGSLGSEALIKALEGHSYSLLKDEQQWRAFDHQNLQTVYAVRVKTRDEVLKDPLKQDYFEIVDRLDASAALPSLADWQAERRAGNQPPTLQ